MSEDEKPEVPQEDLLTARPVNREGGSHGEPMTSKENATMKSGPSSAKLLRGMLSLARRLYSFLFWYMS